MVKLTLIKPRVKKTLNFLSIYSPYPAAISVIIILILNVDEMINFFAICLLVASIILRIVIVILKKRVRDQPEIKTTDWNELRKQLTLILSESKILLDSAVELRSEEVSNIILSEKQVNGNFFEENEELIKSIRNIGINGLLCLLFLVQQQPAIAAVRAIHRTLKIPLATAYRHLQKLSELKLVSSYYEPDKPSKALYRITDEGSSLIIQLYEIIGETLLPLQSVKPEKTQVKSEA